MRLGMVLLGAIFIGVAAVIYLDPALIESYLPPPPVGSEIAYSSVLAFSLGIAGLGMFARGLVMPSTASMMRARAMSSGAGGSEGGPTGYAPGGGGAAPGVVYCSVCGRANSMGAAYCQGCGRPMTSSPTLH